MPVPEIFTIGFTKSSAEHFFERLRSAGVARVIDVRLRTTSQLAGFAKGGDLPYFLREIAGIDYQHEPLLAPTAELLDGYKKGRVTWEEYIPIYTGLLERRRAEELDRERFHRSCLLCSEPTADRCHRRLVAEYLLEAWGAGTVDHL